MIDQNYPTIGSTVTLTIRHIDDEGRGVAVVPIKDHTQPMTFAVRGAFTGDIVEAKVERIYKTHRIVVARAINFVSKSNLHQQRLCSHQSPCPACPFHGLKIKEAHRLKRERIIKALKAHKLDFTVEPIIPHPNEYGYRQRTKLMVGGIARNLTLGMFAPHSHNLIAADDCIYVDPIIRKATLALKRVLNELKINPQGPKQKGLKAIILRLSLQGVAATLITSDILSERQFNTIKILVDNHTLVGIYERYDEDSSNSLHSGTIVKKYGPDLITPCDGGSNVDPESFCQTDSKQAQAMYARVAQFLTEEKNDGWFLDAYAGVGGFSQALKSCGVENIVAVESSSSAQEPLAALRTEYFIDSLEETMHHLQSRPHPTGIVVDPPRKGLRTLAEPLAKLGASRFALVSCDPNAMVSDLKILINEGYCVQKIIPIDFFGGTPEIETVVLLKKSPNKINQEDNNQ